MSAKAHLYDRIELVVSLRGVSGRVYAPGTHGTIVECFENPESYAVDLEFPDESLVGDLGYENFTLTPEQLRVLDEKG